MTQTLTPAQTDLVNHWANFLAEYYGRTVKVDETSAIDGKVNISGDFPQEWSHGGWCEVHSKRVEISKLQNIRKVPQDAAR